MKLKDGDLYLNKETGKIIELRNDYDGYRWFLFRRDSEGVVKTLSTSENDMINTLQEHYEKVSIGVWDKYFLERLTTREYIELKERDLISEQLYAVYEITYKDHKGENFVEFISKIAEKMSRGRDLNL